MSGAEPFRCWRHFSLEAHQQDSLSRFLHNSCRLQHWPLGVGVGLANILSSRESRIPLPTQIIHLDKPCAFADATSAVQLATSVMPCEPSEISTAPVSAILINTLSLAPLSPLQTEIGIFFYRIALDRFAK